MSAAIIRKGNSWKYVNMLLLQNLQQTGCRYALRNFYLRQPQNLWGEYLIFKFGYFVYIQISDTEDPITL